MPADRAPCVNPTNHNLKHRANLFTAMTAAGMSWRMYSESMNPGRDWRLNGAADPTLVADDHVYPADSPVGAIGTKGLRLPFPASLYMTKHNGTVAFQDVRSSPEFAKNNRTLGGGQWDDAIRRSPIDARRLERRSVRRRFAVWRRRAAELSRTGPVR